MGKISSKQIFTYVALLGVVALAAVYFLVYKKNMDAAEATRQNCAALQVRVDALKEYYDNEQMYLDAMEPMKEEIKAVLEPYWADTQEEDIIMQAVYTQNVAPIIYNNVNIGEKGVLMSISEATVKAAGMEEFQQEIAFVERVGTYSNQTDYEGLKLALQSILDSEYGLGIKNIVYSGNEEGKLNGTLDLVFYSVRGTGKEYELPNIIPYLSGTENFFVNSLEAAN